jgi:hypothetical protein
VIPGGAEDEGAATRRAWPSAGKEAVELNRRTPQHKPPVPQHALGPQFDGAKAGSMYEAAEANAANAERPFTTGGSARSAVDPDDVAETPGDA